MVILTCPKCGNDNNWKIFNADPEAGFASGTCGCGAQVYDPHYDGAATSPGITFTITVG